MRALTGSAMTINRRQSLAALFAVALVMTVSLSIATVAAAQSPGYRVVHGWPQLPEGRVLGLAAGVGVDSHGAVLVFHRGPRIWSEPLPTNPIEVSTVAVFDGASGKLLREWGAGQFAMPHGLSVDHQDNVWVTDVALHQVFKYSPDGKLLLTLGERGRPGDDGGHFNRPTDVAVLPDGSFYVSDGYRNTRIAKFSADGKFLSQWGRPGAGPGEFATPHAIAVDPQGRVYVADRQNDRVQVFDSQGRFLKQWKGPKIGRPYGLTLVGPNAAVADGGEQPRDGSADRSGAAVVDLDGKVLQRFGSFGNQDGQFRLAHDIAADAKGALYVVDVAGQRVQKFVPAK